MEDLESDTLETVKTLKMIRIQLVVWRQKIDKNEWAPMLPLLFDMHNYLYATKWSITPSAFTTILTILAAYQKAFTKYFWWADAFCISHSELVIFPAPSLSRLQPRISIWRNRFRAVHQGSKQLRWPLNQKRWCTVPVMLESGLGWTQCKRCPLPPCEL